MEKPSADLPLQRVFTYDIEYILAPGDAGPRTRRVVVEDPAPVRGMGPSIGRIHRTLRESDPEEFGHMQSPHELVIIRVRDAKSS